MCHDNKLLFYIRTMVIENCHSDISEATRLPGGQQHPDTL